MAAKWLQRDMTFSLVVWLLNLLNTVPATQKISLNSENDKKERKVYACRSAACIKERASHWLPPIENDKSHYFASARNERHPSRCEHARLLMGRLQ
eukprot:1160420-Pelagomonas_calceolata.AAC.20